jgi:CheY-like chemotaxis protein
MTRSVLLVEDVAELRSVIRQALRLRGGFEVVAEADDGATAITAAARHQPDIVVLDLGLPDLAGQEVLTRLRTVSPVAQIVVYTGALSADPAPLAEQVAAFVTKNEDVSYLVELLSGLERRRHDTARLELGPDTSEVSDARRFLGEHCAAWGCLDLLDDALIVLSELVTNALIHGLSRCELRLGLSESALRIQVVDQGPGMPDPLTADEGSEHGRGLLIVSLLCEAWGVEALPAGEKIVWAEMMRPPSQNGGDQSAVASTV